MSNNEETYYQRMSSTMNAKCSAIYPYLFNGVRVLDFGCGKDLTIANLVKEFNGTYCPVDNSDQVVSYFAQNGLECYKNIANLDIEFDIIFMSSVYHELISYFSVEYMEEIMNDLTRKLEDNGLIIIRDWKSMSSKEWDSTDTIYYNQSKVGEILSWINALDDNGIINKNNLKINNNSITGTRKDLYNIVYHVTWGLQSINRESQEGYPILNEDILGVMDENGLSIENKEIIWDDSYINYMKPYIDDYEKRITKREKWIAPKEVLVLKR